jgi:hypothetical protein
MGSAAISSALVTEACRVAAKVLVPVVVVCGAIDVKALLRLLELVLMANLLTNETRPYSGKIGPDRL